MLLSLKFIIKNIDKQKEFERNEGINRIKTARTKENFKKIEKKCMKKTLRQIKKNLPNG